MRRHRLAIAACLTLAACASRDEAAWHDEPGYRWRALTITRGTDGFTSIAPRKSGIRFQNAASEKILQGNRVLGQGGGVSLGDVDGDGRPDVFLARTEGCSALYRNVGDLTFEDITRTAGVGASGVGACGRHATGSAFATGAGPGLTVGGRRVAAAIAAILRQCRAGAIALRGDAEGIGALRRRQEGERGAEQIDDALRR